MIYEYGSISTAKTQRMCVVTKFRVILRTLDDCAIGGEVLNIHKCGHIDVLGGYGVESEVQVGNLGIRHDNPTLKALSIEANSVRNAEHKPQLNISADIEVRIDMNVCIWAVLKEKRLEGAGHDLSLDHQRDHIFSRCQYNPRKCFSSTCALRVLTTGPVDCV